MARLRFWWIIPYCSNVDGCVEGQERRKNDETYHTYCHASPGIYGITYKCTCHFSARLRRQFRTMSYTHQDHPHRDTLFWPSSDKALSHDHLSTHNKAGSDDTKNFSSQQRMLRRTSIFVDLTFDQPPLRSAMKGGKSPISKPPKTVWFTYVEIVRQHWREIIYQIRFTLLRIRLVIRKRRRTTRADVIEIRRRLRRSRVSSRSRQRYLQRMYPSPNWERVQTTLKLLESLQLGQILLTWLAVALFFESLREAGTTFTAASIYLLLALQISIIAALVLDMWTHERTSALC